MPTVDLIADHDARSAARPVKVRLDKAGVAEVIVELEQMPIGNRIADELKGHANPAGKGLRR
ncbi:hypothetical protein [Burkholderia glumae]|uniref:hypothetical protein n=1 Tax=Burkholderia glumae TaxID=337 RepID=UPI00214F7D14|nr:hypothetical protein [Burkholderia glumae]